MKIKKISFSLYKMLKLSVDLKIDLKLTSNQCKELVDFIDNPLVVEHEEVCEWVKEEYEMYISPHNNGDWSDKDDYQYSHNSGRKIKYMEE